MLLNAYMYDCPGSLIYMQTFFFALYATATVDPFWTIRESSSFSYIFDIACPSKTSMHCNQLHCNVTIACFCLLVCCLHCMDPALIFP